MTGTPNPFEVLAAAFVLRQRSTNTQAAYRGDLTRFAVWCTAQDLEPLAATAGDIERFRDQGTTDGASTATVSRRLCALSSFFDYAVAQGSVAVSPVGTTSRPVPGASATALLGASDADALIRAAGGLDARTHALTALLLFDGLRLADALSLDAGDVVHGQAGQVEAVTFERRGVRRITVLDHRSASAVTILLAGRCTGPLFLGDSPTSGPGRLTRFGADYLLKRAGQRAGLARPVSANALRRAHVVAAHARGERVAAIAERLGQVDARSTTRLLAP